MLDASIMPAVDSPGSPGLEPGKLVEILRTLAHDSRCCGMAMSIYDPDLDPTGAHAATLVAIAERVFANWTEASP